MSLTQLLMQTAVTFIAASIGAIFGAFLTRRNDTQKHLQELRSAAYADFLRGFAKVGRAQMDGMRDERSLLEEREGRVVITDARSRIAIYGGKEVVDALATFVASGTQTLNTNGMIAFTKLCLVMRDETGREYASAESITKILFS